MESELIIEASPRPRNSTRHIILFALSVCVGALLLVLWFLQPPRDFPTGTSIEIVSGQSGSAIVDDLYENGFLRSRTIFYLLLTLHYDSNAIKAGVYTFDEPLAAQEIAAQITAQASPEAVVRLTIPEGMPVARIAEIASTTLPSFETEMFLRNATPLEGYLFPDTYHVPPDFTAAELIELMQETYTEKFAALAAEMEQHPLTKAEIVTLASIIEREANDDESMKMVAGILQNRLELGMPLQADASIEYVLDKPLSELVPEDLTIDSPYNTYLNLGLPPTPIGNPGLQSVQAVLNPVESNYLFYITGNDGQFYYAETLAEHNRNIALYLR